MTSNIKNIPGRGKLLIARPFLNEAFFSHSVVLLLDTDSNGAIMGIALNVSTDITLHDLIPQFDPEKKIPIFCGGPCDMDRLFVLHTLGDRINGAVQIFNSLYVGGRIEDLVDFIYSHDDWQNNIRFFVGYSGWQKQQLADELAEVTWAIGTCNNPDLLFSGVGIPFWRNQLSALGPDYRQWAVMPTEAELN